MNIYSDYISGYCQLLWYCHSAVNTSYLRSFCSLHVIVNSVALVRKCEDLLIDVKPITYVICVGKSFIYSMCTASVTQVRFPRSIS